MQLETPLRIAFAFGLTALAAALFMRSPEPRQAHAQPIPSVALFGAIPVTASATGTTGATTATLAANMTKTTYLCGFSIRANATSQATGAATVTGILGGTLTFEQFTAANGASGGMGIVEPNIGSMCLPGSAINQAIAVVSAAPGSGGAVSVSAWGYQY